MGIGQSFQQMLLERLNIHLQSWTLSDTIKIKSKWVKGLNLTAKTITLLEENTGVNLHDHGFGHG